MTEKMMIRFALREEFSAAAVMETKDIVAEPRFRSGREENLCGNYGANRSRPPNCGTVKEMEQLLRARRHALLFQTKWKITDSTEI